VSAIVFLFASFTSGGTSELDTEESLDLARYLGRWYQIALIPNEFQKKCARGTVADYSVRPNGHLEVMNSCERKDGTVMTATGVARINDDYNDPARLEVSFAPEWMGWLSFVWGDYWILDIDTGYQAVLVGSPDLNSYGFWLEICKWLRVLSDNLSFWRRSLVFPCTLSR